MKIAFFTEGGYEGKIENRNTPMRTDQAWVCALNATHHPIAKIMYDDQLAVDMHKAKKPPEHYDIGIIIIPKTTGGNTGAKKYAFDRDSLTERNYPLIKTIKTLCNKVLVMQESTHWDWQEDSAEIMIWYYSQLTEADGILCHNDIDLPYYKGITGKPAFILPTLMIDTHVDEFNNHFKEKNQETNTDRVFIAGNWHTTYRGFDAWAIGQEFELPMYGFKSGKFKQNEDLNGINYLPWMNWYEFMYELSKCKYGVQCYQASAGQFPLNCAYLGIPCIGYNDINTQKNLFPNLSVERGDILSARKLANRLKSDKDFYEMNVTMGKMMYDKLYKEDKFIENFEEIINKLINEDN
jgi:hypothetical protein